jgi:hypothetical protein
MKYTHIFMKIHNFHLIRFSILCTTYGEHLTKYKGNGQFFSAMYSCPKSLEPLGIVIIFLIFIYRLKLKVKRLKVALTLDERVEIVFLSGRQG